MTKIYTKNIKEIQLDAHKLMTNDMFMKCHDIIELASHRAVEPRPVIRILSFDLVRTIQSDMIEKIFKAFNQEISSNSANHILDLLLKKYYLRYIAVAVSMAYNISVFEQTILFGWIVVIFLAKIVDCNNSIHLDEIEKAIYDIVKYEITVNNMQNENRDNESLSEDISKIFEEDE